MDIKEQSGEAVLILSDKSTLTRQYPNQVILARGIVPVIHAADPAKKILACFVDIPDQDVLETLKSENIPIVFSVQSALESSRTGASHEPLHVLLPGYASDVVFANRAINENSVGDPVFVEINLYIGETLSDPRWELNSLCALTHIEGMAYGLQLSRLLVGQRLWTADITDIHVTKGRTTHVASWSYKIGPVAVVQHIFAGSISSVPLFSATVIGTTGRLSVRQEFSPGAVTIWSRYQHAHRCPMIPRQKSNIQAPDSWPCGEEFHLAIQNAMEYREDPNDQPFGSIITPLVLRDTESLLGIWTTINEGLPETHNYNNSGT